MTWITIRAQIFLFDFGTQVKIQFPSEMELLVKKVNKTAVKIFLNRQILV